MMTLMLVVFQLTWAVKKDMEPLGEGHLTVRYVAKNAVRIQYTEGSACDEWPDWSYVRDNEVTRSDIRVSIDRKRQVLTIKDKRGRTVFTATHHDMEGEQATLAFSSARDEFLYGLGQFQDGYSNVRGLSRRLTQVNTQISLPMLLSSKGYGVLWNNYGMTEYNPCSQHVSLVNQTGEGVREEVDVTSTEGGEVVFDLQNLWLPPTMSQIVHLEAGRHQVTSELTKDDQPVLYYNKVRDETVFCSPVATKVDYTVFVGSADEVIATYRELTGPCPQMPSWALGYIHCRERFHSQDEILQTANRFHQEQIPVGVIVQDWQSWGKYGWNSMQFDEEYYPDPKTLTDSLHHMGIRFMVSVWSKIDKRSEVGKMMLDKEYYIPGTDWIDFFNPDAAAAYWLQFRTRLVPLGIDAWWQDATEPENDDLAGRMVNAGHWRGDQVRNVYPLLVNKTVYEGLKACGKDDSFVLTRCGFPGIQRYGAALWSGDVGNDWETLRRQITAGLGVQAAGVPWWTYDAGGFFRPHNQYTDQAYIYRMLRWIELSVYLPLMRVHGYMSNTEPWNYGSEAQAIIADCIRERESLRPYIEECARRVSSEGYTLMRPLVFDFADDPQALAQKYEYMFGPRLLVSPVTEPDVTEWQTYLPKTQGRWRDRLTGKYYEGGQTVTTAIDKRHIPVFELEQ